MEKFYITTAIDYVNGNPHLGHAYEKIATDVIARHFRQRGVDVYFLTGTDEHGIKIERTAAVNNISPKEFCDKTAAEFQKEWGTLNVSYDRFIRTTEDDHRKVVQHIFKTLVKKGDIYKASYKGLYCSGCEGFVSPRDLTEDGLCPNHRTKPTEVEEENYFFKLTRYKEQLKQRILNNPDFIQPDFRVNELLNQLENTEDISVSRSINSVTWGIPVPDDDSQVIYVWIDALSNYITGAGYLTNDELFNKYWPADVHMIGKDILKFHAIYWTTLLMAMEIELPKTIYAHGWITVDETKMSKSLGNVIRPETILNEYDLDTPDPLRYFLMTTTPFGRDGNYSDEDLKAKVNADLANNLGNLLNRSLSMLVKYFDGNITPELVVSRENSKLFEPCENAKATVLKEFDKYAIDKAAEVIIGLVDLTNKYVNEEAPWSLAKNPETMTQCGQVLYNVLETMRQVSVMFFPYCPDISTAIWNQLSMPGSPSDMRYSELKWGGLVNGHIATKDSVKPVFLRLDSEFAGEDKKKK